MFYSERKDNLLNIIKERGRCSVHSLAKELYVSEPTIRRDLAELESEGKIKRTYGGAVYCEIINNEIPLILRESKKAAEKRLIACEAAKLIQDGMTVFLDASSTASHIVPNLSKFKDLTVITNSPKISVMLADLNIDSFSTGGILLKNSIAYVGVSAIESVKKFNTDIVFFSSRGITVDGLITDSSVEETDIRKSMLAHADRKVFLCSGDKLGSKYMHNLCDVSALDYIISDIALPDCFCEKCTVIHAH